MNDKKLFISASSREPDLSIARAFYQKFAQTGIQPFLSDKSIKIGEEWSSRIEYELEHTDYFLLILSKNALMSDMVAEEVRWARRIAEQTGRHIDFFPVRIHLPESAEMSYELGGYLNRIQQKTWNDEQDTALIFQEILNAIYLGASAEETHESGEAKLPGDIPYASLPLEYPEGTVRLSSPYYVKRDSETKFVKSLHNDGAMLRIKAPRQFGKTSLLVRLMDEANRAGYHLIALSMQQFDRETVKSKINLMTQINNYAARSLRMPQRWSEFSIDPLDIKANSTSYWETYILKGTDKPVLLAIDEADLLFQFKDVSGDFFSLLRYWHELAKYKPEWPKLRIAITYSAEAVLAIQDINQSPFNVGRTKELTEFSRPEIEDLGRRHHLQLPQKKLRTLKASLGGHPYLTRLALYLLANKEYSFKQLIWNAPREDGPFAEHLKKQYLNLVQNPELLHTMQEILRNGYAENPLVVSKLRSVGLVKGERSNLMPSYDIYKRYFKNVL